MTTSQAPAPTPDAAPVRPGGTMSSAAFWRLVDRLQLPDAEALELIGYAGKLGPSGKRPRFRLSTHQTHLALSAKLMALLSNSGPGVLANFGPPSVPQPTVSLMDQGTFCGLESQSGFVRAAPS